MHQYPKVVGVHIGGHDGGCAVLVDGRLCSAISEERLSRYKYSPNWSASLLYCLAATGIDLGEVDLFVFSCSGEPLPDGFDGEVRRLCDTEARFVSVDHHLSHAIGTFALSPFEKALVVVMDGWGNGNDTESYYIGTQDSVLRIGGNDPERPRAQGIGATYEAFTNFLGFSDLEAGKTMGLSSFGDPKHFREPLFNVVGNQVSSKLERGHQIGVVDFGKRYKLPIGPCFPSHTSEVAWHIAAYVQHQTETTILRLLSDLVQSTGMSSICFSGGVALNCLANTMIRKSLSLDGFFVLPFASDTGLPVGNAIYGHWFLTGEIPKHCLRHCFFGRVYSEEEILASLRRLPLTTRYDRILLHSFSYTKESNIEQAAAQIIADGNTVGWFQGGSELGPRALGHRSIIADPRSVIVRDKLNNQIKQREWFRPFAPSILEDGLPLYFDCEDMSPFMLEAPLVKETRRTDLSAATHIDGTARLQIVSVDQDQRFSKLITEFEKSTGVPAVLNTSFNRREPIVETPGDALLTFLTTDLDYLVLGDYLVKKK